MLNFSVDPRYPLTTLEECGTQLDMVVDLLSCGGDDVSLGETGAAGLADMLRAVSRALDAVSARVRQCYPGGLKFLDALAEDALEEADRLDATASIAGGQATPSGVASADRAAMERLIRRLLDEDIDPSDTLAGRSSAAGGPAAPSPRLTEPRPPARSRRAA